MSHGPRRPGWSTFTALTAVTATAFGAGLLLYGMIQKYGTASANPAQAKASGSALATAPAKPREVTILGAGDVIVHQQVWEQAKADGGGGYDFFPIFEGVSATVAAADLALCHLEGPVTAPGAIPTGYPLFSAPPELLDGLKKAGFDGCSTASTHMLDKGTDGLTRTVSALEKAGLGNAGTARTADEAAVPKIYDVRGIKIAQLAYTYSLGTGKLPAGKEFMVSLINPDVIKAAARKAKEAKADLVVLSLDWGTDGEHDPNADQKRWAADLLASADIDLILGHNTHSVQAMEKIGEKWVVYGMGNEVARHSENQDSQREGVMARMTLTESQPGKWSVSKAEAIATWTEQTPKLRVIELPKYLSNASLSAVTRRFHQATLDRITGYLRLRGADKTGLIVVLPQAAGSASPTPSR